MQQRNATVSIETQPASRRERLFLLRRHPLIFYFLITYGISWGMGLPLIIVFHMTQVPVWLAILLASGPTLSSFMMTAVIGGWPEVRELLRRYVRWRVGLIWYLITIVVLPVLIALVSLTLPGGVASVLNGLPVYPLVYVLTFFAGGPFLEEPGWRGFVLPRLQRHLGPLPGSLLLGFFWGIWHLPLFLIPGYNGSSAGFIGVSTALFEFTLTTTLISAVFAWVSNNTRGSLLLVMLLHAALNTAGIFIPSAQNQLVNLSIMYIVFAALSVIVIAATRGRLSYDRYIQQADALK